MVEQRSPKPRAEGSSPSAPAKKKKSRFTALFSFSFVQMVLKTRHAERAGAKRLAAACGRKRHGAEVNKQGAVRSAPSEQCDYVFEGHIQVLEAVRSAPSEQCDYVFEGQIQVLEAPARNSCIFYCFMIYLTSIIKPFV